MNVYWYQREISFCLTLVLACTLSLVAQKQDEVRTYNSYLERSSTNDDRWTDSAFFLVKLRAPGNTKRNLVEQPRLIRRFTNDWAIVQGLKGKDSANYLSVHRVNNLWKLSQPESEFEEDRNVKKTYTLLIGYSMPTEKLQQLLGEIKIRDVRNTIVLIECSFNDILKYVLPLKEVVYVGLESRKATVESKVLDLILSANNVSYVHHTYPDLTGSDLTVSVKENSFDATDIDLQGRVVTSPISSSTIDNHATEMATIIAGAGNSFVIGRGVAKEANLSASDFARLEPDLYSHYSDLGISIQNHSYGTTIENMYGALANAFDESSIRNSTLLHVFSSGNDGLLASATGAYAGLTGFANLTGNFKMAKNVLTIGSVDTVGRPISFSSKGPAYDGRIKPELVAYSTAGSSNSAAVVSGIALLLQQAYKDAYGELPSATLLRALLINGARDVGPAGIDFSTGFGNVDAAQSLRMLTNSQFRSGSVSTGESVSFNIVVPDNTRNLKVSLVWNDPAAQPNDAVALVNDLDLTVTTPDAVDILPWKLNSSASLVALTSAAVRGEDHLNTIEQVTVENLSTGTYTFTVKGFTVQDTPQEFYLTYQWEEKDEFTWFYPTGSDNMPYNGETGTYFHWSSTLSAPIGILEYTLDNGATWNGIASEVNLSSGLLRWNAPTITAVAQARMRVGTETFLTERFTISRPVKTSVGFNCSDSVMINWSKISGASSYLVQTFRNSKLEDFSVVSDTVIIISKSANPSELFSVQPLLVDDFKALRGPTFNYTEQGVQCYLVSFFSELQGTEGIRLRLQLGTLYGVAAVTFERMEGTDFIPLGVLTSFTSSQLEFLDVQPQQGQNIYRARIQFSNGEEILSDISSDYFLTEIPFLLFPNPVRVAEDLQIISKQFVNQNLQLDFYKMDGAAVYSQKLFSDRETITIPPLTPGLYLYSIATEEGTSRGKILILP